MRDRLPPQVPGVSLKELKYVKLSKIDELILCVRVSLANLLPLLNPRARPRGHSLFVEGIRRAER